MTTQAMWAPPPRSPTMVGRAVDTIVWSNAARSMPSIRAPIMSNTRRWLSPSIASPGPAVITADCSPPAEMAPLSGELVVELTSKIPFLSRVLYRGQNCCAPNPAGGRQPGPERRNR